MYELRPHQKRANKACMEYINGPSTKKVIVVEPTASGKSIIIGSAANNVKGSILCIQPAVVLLKQNIQKYRDYGNEASIYSASAGSKEISHVTFCTPQSIVKEIAYFKKYPPSVVFVDEGHLNSKHKSVMGKFLKEINAKKVICFTATPLELAQVGGRFNSHSELRMLNRSRANIFNEIISVTQIKELIDKGFWTDLIYDVREVDTGKLVLNSTGNDYTLASMEKHYKHNSLHNKIADTVDELFKEGRESILIFIDSISNAEALKLKIDGAEVMHSKISKVEEDRIEEGFKGDKIKVVIVIGKWVIGFDKPNLSAAIMARPTNSFSVYYQAVGRLVRTCEGKKDARLVDFSGNIDKFGKLDGIEFLEVNGKWGMYNNGVPMTAGALPYPKPIGSTLSFGTYKDKEVKEIPTSYLTYLSANFTPKKEEDKIFLNKVRYFLESSTI